MTENPISESGASILKRFLSGRVAGFVRKNKIKSIIAFLVIVCSFAVLPLPFGEIDDLNKANPGVTAFMREHEGVARSKGRAFYRFQKWIPYDRIPKYVTDAIVVAEDGTFWSHSGFDWFELKESLRRNFSEGRAARGASTITQQLVKNLFLSSSKNPLRKLREWILTFSMERTLTKSRILEIYLNVIEWGDGVYGIEAASQLYFNKSASDLTRDEATRLAAIIPSPKRHGANEDSQYVARRAQVILQRMKARGMIPVASVFRDSSVLNEDFLVQPVDSAMLNLDGGFNGDSLKVGRDSL